MQHGEANSGRNRLLLKHSPVVDPGFPQGGGANSQGAPTYDFAKISQKLHEIERIWTPGDTRDAHPPGVQIRSATALR